MKRIKKNPDAKMTEYPTHVLGKDTKYPESGRSLPYTKIQELGLEENYGTFTFYLVKDLGWVLCTLHISNASRRQAAGTPARSYAIGLKDSKVYTVGRGPHVEKEITVYLSQDNIDRLTVYVDLWKKGMAEASQIRDRISSRRAQGQLHRAAGRTHWYW